MTYEEAQAEARRRFGEAARLRYYVQVGVDVGTGVIVLGDGPSWDDAFHAIDHIADEKEASHDPL